MNQLSLKIQQAVQVIEDAFDTFSPEELLIAWSAGKDSTLVLKLIVQVCKKNNLQVPTALDIDQNDQFETLLEFRDEVANDWDISLLIVKNHDFLDRIHQIGDALNVCHLNDQNKDALQQIGYKEPSIIWQPDSPICNHLLKTVPINQALLDRGYKGLFTGIRWDEHGARAEETYFSARQNPDHTRIHPILHFTERDVWDAHFALNIPFSNLYAEGYRSLGTKSGTKKDSDIPAWQQDLIGTSERALRNKDKEKVMEQLRAWGYM